MLGIMWVSRRQPCGETAMIVISPDDLARRDNGVTIVRCERLRRWSRRRGPSSLQLAVKREIPGRLTAPDSSQSAAANLPSLPKITFCAV